jgi:hypothetical protein
MLADHTILIVPRAPPNKALQLTSHSVLQSTFGRVALTLWRLDRAAKALWLAA